MNLDRFAPAVKHVTDVFQNRLNSSVGIVYHVNRYQGLYQSSSNVYGGVPRALWLL